MVPENFEDLPLPERIDWIRNFLGGEIPCHCADLFFADKSIFFQISLSGIPLQAEIHEHPEDVKKVAKRTIGNGFMLQVHDDDSDYKSKVMGGMQGRNNQMN